jgi:hypothetical protein
VAAGVVASEEATAEAGGEARRAWWPWLWLVTLFAGLAAISWQAWANPIADGGREMYVPWRLADGEMLYRDLFFVYGPVVPYWHAALFRTFGVHLNLLYASGLVVGAATIVVAFLLARLVVTTGLALAAASLVAVGCVFHPSADNCVFPYSFNASYASLMNLLAGWLLLTSDGARRGGRPLLAATCVAFSALAKQEFGVGGLAFLVIHAFWCLRTADPRTQRTLGWALAIALGLPALGYGFFAWQVGPYRLVTESLWPHRMLSAMARFERYTVGSTFDLRLVGRLLVHASGILATMAVLVAAAYAGERRTRGMGFLLMLAAAAGTLASPLGPGLLDFLYAGRAHLTNAVVLAFAAVLSWRRDRLRNVRWVVLLAFLQTWRSPLFGGVSVYSAFVNPAALVVLIWLLAEGWASLASVRSRSAWQRAVLAVCVTACAVTVTVKARVFRRIDHRVATERGALYVHPSVGPALEGLLRTVEARTAPADRVLLLPEDNAVHFLSGRRSVSRHYQIIPGILDADGERALIATADLERVRFATVSNRMTAEYGAPFFGVDYCQEIGRWLRARFTLTQTIGNPDRHPPVEPGLLFPRAGYGIDVYEREG